MKFIIDAQLPYQLSSFLLWKGFDVKHTNDLPNKDKSSDFEIKQLAEKENRIVITKDSDFMDSYFLHKSPAKLLLISTGNINNKALIDIFSKNIPRIAELFDKYSFIEMDNEYITAHE